MNEFLLLNFWENTPLTVKQYSNLYEKYLLMLISNFNTKYELLNTSTSQKMIIENNFSNFKDVIFDTVQDSELKYINENPLDFGFSINSKTYIHFINSFKLKLDSKELSITLSTGSIDKKDTSSLTIDFLGDHIDLNFILKVMKLTISFFNPNFSSLTTRGFMYEVTPNDDDLQVGWYTYVNRNVKFNDDNFMIEEFNDGAIIKISESIISHENPKHLADGRQLQKYLYEQEFKVV